MDPNNNGVTTPLSSVDEVNELLDHASHVEEVIEAFSTSADRSVNARLADAHKELGITFKRADILANVAIAEEVRHLTEVLARLAPPTMRPHLPHYTDHLAEVAAGDPNR